jgi:hypothetical protein
VTFYYFDRMFRDSKGAVWCRQIRAVSAVIRLHAASLEGCIIAHLVLRALGNVIIKAQWKKKDCNRLCVDLYLVLFSKVSVAQTLAVYDLWIMSGKVRTRGKKKLVCYWQLLTRQIHLLFNTKFYPKIPTRFHASGHQGSFPGKPHCYMPDKVQSVSAYS